MTEGFAGMMESVESDSDEEVGKKDKIRLVFVEGDIRNQKLLHSIRSF
ncbi:hypothetical protein THIOSC13_1280005 [uncultured Thiomicrorhabdus sp.]